MKNEVIVDWVKNKKFTITELWGTIFASRVSDLFKFNNVRVCECGCLTGYIMEEKRLTNVRVNKKL